jgi:ribosomal protein S18 acetylase RimI-like enzyme
MAVKISIRVLEEGDVAACVALYQDAYATPPYHYGWDEETSERIIRDVSRLFPHECFVAEASGEVVGFILCSSLAGLRATVEEFAVAPQNQRRGIGRKLLQHVIDHYRSRRVPYLELVANNEAPAYRFYCRMGFDEPGSYRLMTKELS